MVSCKIKHKPFAEKIFANVLRVFHVQWRSISTFDMCLFLIQFCKIYATTTNHVLHFEKLACGSISCGVWFLFLDTFAINITLKRLFENCKHFVKVFKASNVIFSAAISIKNNRFIYFCSGCVTVLGDLVLK